MTIHRATLSTVLWALVASGCIGATGDTESTMEALRVVECNPRDAASCDRDEECTEIRARDGASVWTCTSGDECRSADDCRDGYTCVSAACVALDRVVREIDGDVRREIDRELDRDRALCPEGSVPGIPLCAAGYEVELVTRLCATCVPSRDREFDAREAERRIAERGVALERLRPAFRDRADYVASRRRAAGDDDGGARHR